MNFHTLARQAFVTRSNGVKALIKNLRVEFVQSMWLELEPRQNLDEAVGSATRDPILEFFGN